MNKILSRRAFSSFIKSKNLPVCINCVHFIHDETDYPYDPPPNDKKFGKCKLFGYQNMITGEIIYDYATETRNNENKCGVNAQYFTFKK